MRILRQLSKLCLPCVLPPALAILAVPGICGCGRDQPAPPSSRSTAASGEGTPRPVPSGNHHRGADEPKGDASNLLTSPPAGKSSESNDLAPSGEEGSPVALQQEPGDDRSGLKSEVSQPAPGDVRVDPLDALEALGATVKTNVKGDVISVDLKEMQVTDADLSHLKEMTKIKTLNLSLTPVTDEGLANLEGLTGLTHLYLFGTDVTDAGLEHLKGLTGIQVLCLDDTRITDAGLVHLKNMTRLEKLHIQSQGTITDDGLGSLTGLTELVELRVGGTDVTDDGVDKLEQSLPRCQIAR